MNIGWIMLLPLMKNKFDAAIHKEILLYLYLFGVLTAHCIYDASSISSPSLMKISAHRHRSTPLLEYRLHWNEKIHINNTGYLHSLSCCAQLFNAPGCLTWGGSLVLFLDEWNMYCVRGCRVLGYLITLLGLNEMGWGSQPVYPMV